MANRVSVKEDRLELGYGLFTIIVKPGPKGLEVYLPLRRDPTMLFTVEEATALRDGITAAIEMQQAYPRSGRA